MANTACRILMPTDVPFWRRSDGAQQRIASLVEHFSRPPFTLAVYYLGRWEASDEQYCRDVAWSLTRFDSAVPPTGIPAKLRWYWSALKQVWSAPQAVADPQVNRSLRLSDYRWPFAGQRFAEMVEQFAPDVVLCQYITTSYLLESLKPSRRQQTLCVLDTHDLLHRRCQQFREAGLSHWLEIDLAEEVAAWNGFDILLAIQPDESKFMSAQVTGPQVMVVGHAVAVPSETGSRGPQDDGQQQSSVATNPLTAAPAPATMTTIRLGYIGSDNGSNREALGWFLSDCWPALHDSTARRFELVIAGGISTWVDQWLAQQPSRAWSQSIQCMGQLEQVSDFYRRVDLVINPVQLGTGMKIKNIEALAHRVPVLTTPAGTAGLPDACLAEMVTVAARSEFGQKLAATDWHQRRADAADSARGNCGQALANPYRELTDLLLAHAGRNR